MGKVQRNTVGIGEIGMHRTLTPLSTHRMCLQANTRVDSGNYRGEHAESQIDHNRNQKETFTFI